MHQRFELGPIRPPSEASSLLVRVTRNCPWNRCAFCPVYKGAPFSIREAKDVLQDIESMASIAASLRELSKQLGQGGEITRAVREAATAQMRPATGIAQIAAFLAAGGRSVFLQDANSIVMPTDQLVEILAGLRESFPTIERVTTYARAHTLLRKKTVELERLFAAGLNRVHVGLESGSDKVLSLIEKGVNATMHIDAGKRAKAVGMELSEYVMPGLGGQALWREHAIETARVLNAIDPAFIRLRTTAIAPDTGLERLATQGDWLPMDDEQVITELRLFLEHLDVTSTLCSDHILNLLAEIDGQLPDDKPRLMAILDRFLALDPRMRQAFILARRGGMVASLDEMDEEPARESAMHLLDQVEMHYGGDVNAAIRDLMSQFV
jgi:hypothetical protein